MFDRCCINNDETPKALEMEQDNVIEVYKEQTQLHQNSCSISNALGVSSSMIQHLSNKNMKELVKFSVEYNFQLTTLCHTRHSVLQWI